ncbi:MAG: cytochrome c oxidase assembly protein [Chromatiales bacterium]|nr:cytochrome c oxidase assembly protein [Chromatiales bacterium]
MKGRYATYRTPFKLGIFVLGMFGFGFALVPLYNVFCEITGLNGKTGVVDESVVASYAFDPDREIVVEFVTSLNQGLRWEFAPEVTKMKVHPGKVYTVNFHARNLTDRDVTGQAIPSVAPNAASRYFSKTECFCFTQQLFQAGEGRDMPVSFVINPKLPAHVTTITLSYTFFDTDQKIALHD